MINYEPRILGIKITDEGIKPVNSDNFRGEIFNNSNYKIYILKEKGIYVYVGITNQGIGKRFGQSFRAYIKAENNNKGKDGYSGYKWIAKYMDKELSLFVFDLGKEIKEEKYTESIEAEIVYLIRNRYNMWPTCQNEIHFNNEFDDALGKAIRIFNVVENIE